MKKKNRIAHLKILSNVAASLGGMQIALNNIEELDKSVTAEEAGHLLTDLNSAIQSLNRIRNLIKERTNQ